MVDAIQSEIVARKEEINVPIQTIYFGGGTPSLLTLIQIEKLLDAIRQHYKIESDPELTLEANPEDLNPEKSKALFNLGVNRLSIGIQTFDENKLQWMNRIHSATDARNAFENARQAGFENISLDLIYAIPDHDQKEWEHDLESITKLEPEHISLYGLTIESQTVFGKWEEKGQLHQLSEDRAAQQYLFAISKLNDKGYIQYEVSNFGKEGLHSRHNHAYWSGEPYLGVGPGAHSFDGNFTRRFNVRNNAKYLKEIEENGGYFELEELSNIQRINERILTELRTKKGIDLRKVEELSDVNLMSHQAQLIDELSAQDFIEIDNHFLRLKPHGFLVADEIALRLFFPE